jgi:Rha family phage regulatory protein
MKELVYKNNSGKDVTTSLLIAETFGKEHKNVLRDIEALDCSTEFNALNFEPIEYFDSRNRSQKAFEITKDGFSFLVMGYTGGKAAQFKEQFIYEFNRREALLKNDEYILSRAFSILNEKTKLLEAELSESKKIIEIQAPKVDYYDAVINAAGLFPISKIAQQANMSAKKLNEILREKKVQRKVNGTWMLTAPYLNKGYANLKTYSYEDGLGQKRTSQQLQWTEKGKVFIMELLGLAKPAPV